MNGIDRLSRSVEAHREAMIGRGILMIMMGVLILVWPVAILASAVIILAIYLVLAGVIGIIRGLIALGRSWSGLLVILGGILGIVVGVMMLKYPGITILTGVYLAGVWFILQGFFEMFSDWDQYEGSRMLSVVTGILSIIVGIMLLNRPIVNGLAFYWVLGIYGVVAGTLSIVSAMIIKSHLEKEVHEMRRM